MSTRLPPIRGAAATPSPTSAAAAAGGGGSPTRPSTLGGPSPRPLEEVVARRTTRKSSPNRADSPAQLHEEKRLARQRRSDQRAQEKADAAHAQRENGFRYNAFESNGVFSTFSADTLVLEERDRKTVEIAVARRRALLEFEKKQREIARADELRRRKAEQQRIQKQHDLKVARETAELKRKADEAAQARKARAAAVSLIEKRRKEIEAARDLSVKRESHRETRRAGKDPHLEKEQAHVEQERRTNRSPTGAQSPRALSPSDTSSVRPEAWLRAVSVILDSFVASPASDSSVRTEEGLSMAIVASLLGA